MLKPTTQSCDTILAIYQRRYFLNSILRACVFINEVKFITIMKILLNVCTR